MDKRLENKGFAAIEAVLILVIAVLIGAVGYKVYNTKTATDKITNDTEASLQQAPSASANAVKVPAKITSSADLDQANKALDSYDSSSADNSDLSQLDSELGAF
ncbi:MAG TPA: hypothetical protein VFW52_03770 [Candidatus Saccharimonadales bacterium]|nr:hypothetical protein [Candidatus Saccharimonadales bacterium]